MSLPGAKLFGMELSDLNQEEVDPRTLRLWVTAFSGCLDDTYLHGDETVSFESMFSHEFMRFCCYVASFDGDITERHAEAINRINPLLVCTKEDLLDCLDEFVASGTATLFPLSFLRLVEFIADSNHPFEHEMATEVSIFYHQVAKYIYSVEHNDDFDASSKASSYLEAYKKYVERASVLGYEIPADDSDCTIQAVCQEWSRLEKQRIDDLKRNVCGEWVGKRGPFLQTGISGLSLTADGLGCATKKRFLGVERIAVAWDIKEVDKRVGPSLNIAIPELNIGILMFGVDSEGMAGMVFDPNQRFNGTMVTFERK